MRRAALIGLLVLSACGEPPATTPSDPGVLHLDLRLEDGTSPLEHLNQESGVVAEWRVRGLETLEQDLSPWTLDNAVALEPIQKQGVRLRVETHDPENGRIHAGLRLKDALDAELWNGLEVEGYFPKPSGASLSWIPLGTDGRPGPRQFVEIAGPSQRGLQVLQLELGHHAAWNGQVQDLRLHPQQSGGQNFDLRRIRMVRTGFTAGHDPSGQGDVTRGDAGLFDVQGDLRRAYVSDLGVPLQGRCTVPIGGRFVVEFGVERSQEVGTEPIHVSLDVRASGTWRSLHHERLDPVQDALGDRWRTLSADLSEHAGEEVDLRVRAWRGAAEDAGTGGSLAHGHLRWASPRVLPRRGEDRRPDVLLLTLDTLRKDALSCYGGSVPTPHLDALAERGLIFDRAWSACNSTTPSHTSILTGLHVPTHGVLNNRARLDTQVRTITQELRAGGYYTAAAVSVHHLQAGFTGLGRGFDAYFDVVPGSLTDGGKTLDHLEPMLEHWGAIDNRPLFLWVHLFDPHTPYGPPSDFLAEYVTELRARGGEVPPRQLDTGDIGPNHYLGPGQFLDGVNNAAYARFLYEAGVAYTDRLVGQLLGDLERHGFDRTAIAVVADHGENMGEYDVWYGHQLLYPDVMNVPLILALPDGPTGRVDTIVSSLDLAPTLLNYAGLPPVATHGEDLLRLLRDPSADRRVYFTHSSGVQAGCRDPQAHFVHNLQEYGQIGPDRVQPQGMNFLYDVRTDPDCLVDLSAQEPERTAAYEERLLGWYEASASGVTLRAELSAEDEQRLDALGYGGDDEE